MIFVRGLDIVPFLQPWQAGFADRVEPELRAVAAELGLGFHAVETDVRELSDQLVPWEAYCGSPLAAIGHFFAPIFDRVLIATDGEWATQVDYGPTRMVDTLLSSEELEIVDWGGALDRFARLELISGHPLVRRTLRTCWKNTDGAWNCCRCRKCTGTMVGLEILGVLPEFPTYPEPLDVAAIAGFDFGQPVVRTVWNSLLAAARRHGREDLVRVIEPALARAEAEADPVLAAEAKAAAAEARTATAEARLAVLTGSRSWRLTEPLRQLTARARERVRPGAGR